MTVPYKGQSPVTIRYWRRPIKSHPDLCRVMAAIYFRETKKRLFINLPGFFDPNKLKELDTRIYTVKPDYYDGNPGTRIMRWEYSASTAISKLLEKVPASEITKPMLDAAINQALKDTEGFIV